MKAFELNKIDKLYFGYEDIARTFGIRPASAKVTASRYVKQGLLLRLKKNIYVLRAVWSAAGREEKFRLANIGQTPSYLSLMTALDYYEVTTQMQRDFLESVVVKRTKEIRVDGNVFRYAKIDPKLYFGFSKKNGFFMATPEKALLDAFYLMSYGRYTLDISGLDADRLDRESIKRLSEKFPPKTRNLLQTYGYLQPA
jgi:predicted transcriptional regulator of viral defense system